eukprot:3221871-Amphidinium_carterae.1
MVKLSEVGQDGSALLHALLRGESAPVERLMQVCESRLDNFCWRTGWRTCMVAHHGSIMAHVLRALMTQ